LIRKGIFIDGAKTGGNKGVKWARELCGGPGRAGFFSFPSGAVFVLKGGGGHPKPEGRAGRGHGWRGLWAHLPDNREIKGAGFQITDSGQAAERFSPGPPGGKTSRSRTLSGGGHLVLTPVSSRAQWGFPRGEVFKTGRGLGGPGGAGSGGKKLKGGETLRMAGRGMGTKTPWATGRAQPAGRPTWLGTPQPLLLEKRGGGGRGAPGPGGPVFKNRWRRGMLDSGLPVKKLPRGLQGKIGPGPRKVAKGPPAEGSPKGSFGGAFVPPSAGGLLLGFANHSIGGWSNPSAGRWWTGGYSRKKVVFRPLPPHLVGGNPPVGAGPRVVARLGRGGPGASMCGGRFFLTEGFGRTVTSHGTTEPEGGGAVSIVEKRNEAPPATLGTFKKGVPGPTRARGGGRVAPNSGSRGDGEKPRFCPGFSSTDGIRA